MYTTDTFLSDPPSCGCELEDFYDCAAHDLDCFGHAGPRELPEVTAS